MLDRKSAPQFVKIKDFHLPSPETIELANGIPLVLYEDVQQKVLKLELVYKAGKWFESKRGVSHFTAQMLERGTSKNTAYQIAEAFDQYGCSLEINAGFDFTSVSLYTLSRNISRVLPLLCELVTEASFPESEFALMKDVFQENLKINNKKNSYVAGKAIRQNIFGNLHPYGSSLEESDVDNLAQVDLLNFFNTRFVLHQIYITGSLHVDEKQILINDLGDLRVLKDLPYEVKLVDDIETSAQHIEMPGSVQSSLRLGKRIINRNHEDYPAFVLLNHILGGYFGSRLMKNIREEKGLTYGIHSSINALRNDAIFLIGTDVNKENEKLAVAEIKAEINKLQESLVDQSELETTKNHLLGSLQLEAANPFSIAEKIKSIRLNELTPDFYNFLFSKIVTCDAEALRKIAVTYLDTNTLFQVSVG